MLSDREGCAQDWEKRRAPVGGNGAEAELQRAQARIAQCDRKLARATGRLLSEDEAERITKHAFDLVVSAIEDERAAAEADVERLQAELGAAGDDLPPWDDVVANIDDWTSALAQGTIPAQRNVLRQLVEHVVPVRIGRGKYAVDITWTDIGEGLRWFMSKDAAWAPEEPFYPSPTLSPPFPPPA